MIQHKGVSLLQADPLKITQSHYFKGLRIYSVQFCEDCLPNQRQGWYLQSQSHKICQEKWIHSFIEVLGLSFYDWNRQLSPKDYDELK